ncbi:unnamed protein product [Ranitomeya imitator]|uniref:Uncharacterized protein n=1 Tax=Ranitomeya imitator TaxID=111125 RepID=A0ABN9L3N7_9NEOB|nr:unnamed protein product [Ranitomeya imitator]
MTYKAIYNLSPPYICDLISRYSPARNLRFSQDLLLYSPTISSSHNRIQDFSRASPLLWNSLPQHIRLSPTIETFKKNLKTHLFRQAYNLQNDEVIAVASMNYDPIVSKVAEVMASGKPIRKRDVETGDISWLTGKGS